MKNKGFTLVELLAVIVILGIIMVIASSSVSKAVEQSRIRTRFIAAKEIIEIAAAYIETESDSTSGITSYTYDGNVEFCVNVQKLVEKEYLESDVTNPKDEKAKNIIASSDFGNQRVCTLASSEAQDSEEPQNYVIDPKTGYETVGYKFNGYVYIFE